MIRQTFRLRCLLVISIFCPQSFAADRVAGRSRPFHFENDILPVFTRFGCNSSSCHGKAEGQNGFKLSVFGFDPAADYDSLLKEGRGRRIFTPAPEHSLLLQKISGGVAHGGGIRIARGTDEFELLRAWIQAGMPFGDPKDPKVVHIRVEPCERVMEMNAKQQIRVIAVYGDGRETDVTHYARFQTNQEGLAAVTENGLVTTGNSPGEVAIMAAYMGSVGVFKALVPRRETIEPLPRLPANNFIDRAVWEKLQKLHIRPSEPAEDGEYLRRVYLDILGTLPTAVEARSFLEGDRPERRAIFVNHLLHRPEFADYWALKWADLLRVDRQVLGAKQAYAYYRWIRESFAANKPMDQFAREIITAEGPLAEDGPANFYKVVRKPGEAASTLSQVFLGVRIACAECHHHPYDRWSQADYLGMQAYFTPVELRNSGAQQMVMEANRAPATMHPRTGMPIYPHALGSKMPGADPPGNRRESLADWLTAPDNPWFAKNIVNRTWAHFLGRGFVEPVDDVRVTNPPTNPQLLDALAQDFIRSKYDFKELIRSITSSQAYQLSSRPNATNEQDEQNYSRALLKRIDAEVLLDMVCQATGVPERFSGMPAGTRAIQLWDSQVPHYFLKLFGRPVRASACECERNQQPGVSQVLHLLNGAEIHGKLVHPRGTIARLVRDKTDNNALVEELYLTFFSRMPSITERQVAQEYLQKEPARRREAAEDLAWGMMNSLEFVFNH